MTTKTPHPDASAAARPKETGSRQQTHPGQNSQTGSPKTDREYSRGGGADAAPKPPGAK